MCELATSESSWEESVDRRIKSFDVQSRLELKPSNCSEWFESEPKPREVIVENFLYKANVGLISGPGGTGKSYFTMQLGMAVATAYTKFIRNDFVVRDPGGVLYVNLEDDADEQHRRFSSICNYYKDKIGSARYGGFRKRLEKNFHWLPVTGKLKVSLFPDEQSQCKDALIEGAREIQNLKLIILDPASRLSDGDFNKSEDVTRFIQTLEEVATATGAMILLVTHTNKSSTKEANLGVTAVLGSQAFTNSARWVLTMMPINCGEASKFKIDRKEMSRFVKYSIPKANYLPAGLIGIEYLRRDASGALEYFDSKQDIDLTPLLEWIRDNPNKNQTQVRDAMKKTLSLSSYRHQNKIFEELSQDELIRVSKGKNNSKLYQLNRGVVKETDYFLLLSE